MAVSDNQKLDYLWKKVGFNATKTDTATNKLAFNEAIPSPTLIRGDTIWSQANSIPYPPPGATGGVVTVYQTTSRIECTVDNTTVTSKASWKTNLTDWIDPQFGSLYLVKIYRAPTGTSNPAAAGGTQIFQGSTNDWFFDYQSGVLNFIGENIPSTITSGTEVIFVYGYRYTGTKGSSDWNSVYSTTQSNSASWGSGGSGNTVLQTNSANWNSVYTSVKDTSASWDTAYTNLVANSAAYLSGINVNLGDIPILSATWTAAYTNLVNNSAAYLSGANVNLGDIPALSANWTSVYTTFSFNSGRYDSNWTTTSSNSANWSSVYTTVSANSANWQTAYNNAIYTVNGTANQIVSTPIGNNTGNNSVTLSLPSNLIIPNDLTVQGNLTALGTSTFQNTIFTTTSALSVINTGPGPALYVFQAAGPYDVASFYDGDGIEVLHVGNAQGGGNPLGQVGINTSFPSTELTVNGAISSNGAITVLGGNSNQWNSTYATVCTLSASWEESGDILPTVINYLSTNNVSISGLTVTQNLSVGGTIFSSATALVIANFETIIGNNTNSSFTINHNLNTDKIQVTVYDVINNIASYPSIQIINSNSISISFGFIPSLNSYRILVYGLVPSNQINAYGQIYTITYATTGLGNIPTLSGNWNSTYETVCALSALWSQGGQNAGTASYTLTAENFIISNSSSWAVDTTANTVYGVLPASPSSGFTIKFLDAKQTWAANNLIIINNGNNIESLTEDLSANINGYSLSLTYVGGSIGWRVY
jgi:hypothetical protein